MNNMKQYLLTVILFGLATLSGFAQQQMTDYEVVQNLIVSERLKCS